MHDQTDRTTDPIEEMPAAPEAVPDTRDADAPSWSGEDEAPHRPAGDPGLAEVEAEALITAAADAAAGGAAGEGAGDVAAPGVPVMAERVEITGGGAQRIEGHEVTVNQGGAAMIRGDHVRVDQGGAMVIVARRVDVREGGAVLLLARRVTGDVKVALDWRALATLVAGIVAILVVRGRR